MMRILRCLYFVSFLIGAPLAAQGLPDRTLSLEESVRLATNNSQGLLSSREDVNIALQRVREAQSLFFPKLDLNANWSKFSVDGSNPFMVQPALGPTLIPDNPRQNFYTARANIYQTVYEGGRSRNTWRQARISYERAKNINESLQLRVEASAKQAYYDLLLAQERRREYETLLIRLSSVTVYGGNLSEDLRREEESALVRAGADRAALQEREAQLSYLRTLNLELNTDVQLKGNLATRPVELDLQKLLAWSSQYRSELRETEYQQELDALGISLSLAERTPTVGFGASYERTGNEIDLPTANWAGTLNINLPVSISDIFYGWAKVRERRAQYRQATLRHAEASDQVQQEVRSAYIQYRFWQEQLAPREAAFHRMEKLVERARGSRRDSAERTMAERLLMESRLRYLEAIHGHLSALAALEKAVGHSINDG